MGYCMNNKDKIVEVSEWISPYIYKVKNQSTWCWILLNDNNIELSWYEDGEYWTDDTLEIWDVLEIECVMKLTTPKPPLPPKDSP